MPDKATTRLTQRDIARMAEGEPDDRVAGAEQPQRRDRADPGRDPGPGAEGDPRDRLRRPIRWPGGCSSGATGSSASSPTSRCSRARAATSTTRSWSASRSCAERLGCDLLLFTSAPVRRAGGGSSTRTTGCGSPTAASCSVVRSPATSWPGWSPRSTRSSPSAAATTPAARSRTSAPTTPRPRRRSSSGRSPSATGGSRTSGRATGAESSADRLRGFRRTARQPGTARTADCRPAAGRGARRPAGPADHRRLRRGAGGRGRAGRGGGRARDRRPGRPVRDRARRRRPGRPRPASTSRGFHVPRQEMGRQATELPRGRPERRRRGGHATAAACELAEGTTLTAPKGFVRCRQMYSSSAAGWAGSPRRWPRCAPVVGRADRGVRLARRAADQPGRAAGRAHLGRAVRRHRVATAHCATASATTTGATTR